MNSPPKPPRPAHLAPVPNPPAEPPRPPEKTREELEAELAELRARVSKEPTQTPREGYLPGMGESVPPRGVRFEPHFNITVGESGTQPGIVRPLRVDQSSPGDSEIPVSGRQKAKDAIGKATKQPAIVALLSSLLGTGAGVGGSMLNDKDPPQSQQAKEVYGLLMPEVQRLSTAVATQAEQNARFQGWMLGYLKATGVSFDLPNDAPAPTATTVEIKTAPAAPSAVAPVIAPTVRGAAPKPARVMISTPPPKPAPVPEAAKLPELLPGSK